jgi:NAD dependent epimerase/dehydratase family enzyme
LEPKCHEIVVLSTLARRCLGGSGGGGRQYVSWIHGTDFGRAVEFLIERDDLCEPINISSPSPMPQAEFMRTLRSAWGVRVGLPATDWMAEIGCLLTRHETELILKSRRVVPTRLSQAGFEFTLPHWGDAARELVGQIRALKARVDSSQG